MLSIKLTTNSSTGCENMAGILLDTGFLHALRLKKDEHHALATGILEGFGWAAHAPILVPSTVVAEVYTLTNFRTNGNRQAISSLDVLFWGDDRFFTIVPVPQEDLSAITQVMSKLTEPGRILSFTDASLIFIARKYSVEDIVTFDSHFNGLLTIHAKT